MAPDSEAGEAGRPREGQQVDTYPQTDAALHQEAPAAAGSASTQANRGVGEETESSGASTTARTKRTILEGKPTMDLSQFPLRILADGSATDEAWGVGVLVTGPPCARVAGDQLGHLDVAIGGSLQDLYPDTRGSSFQRQEADAIAEAFALYYGAEISLVIALERNLGQPAPVISRC